ncbi:MAG: hypothetical protein BHV87_02940 [Clostridiales bacterium 36_14]|nr:MAG: hypothetical protein BHV87_02940 [Clostridiales bacterium 36_14]
MKLKYICKQMVRILHCNIVHINSLGEIEACYGDMAEKCNPLFTDLVFFVEIHNREKKDYPEMLYEKNSILYAIIPFESGKIVVGPISTEKQTRDLNKYMIQTHKISEEAGFRLSFCELKVFGAGVLMLYHWISGNELTLSELWKRNEIEELDIAEVKGTVSQVIFQHQERELPHNPYDQELREMDSIRQGDVDMLRRSLSETYRGEVGQLAKTQIRQAKNIAICVITLASRAAISGGMIPEEAFSIVDGYIMMIEEMNNAVKIDAMMRQAEYEFAELVAKIHENRQKNELVERTKNYIFQNLHSEIIIGEVGKEIGGYLSDLFHKVEGITIQQFIRREKVRLAENMLRYSEYDVKDIANYLSFCSQSYFGSVFKDQTGMSPAKYRKMYGQWKKQNKL